MLLMCCLTGQKAGFLQNMIYNPPLKSEILQAQNSEPVRPVRFAALCMLIAPGTKLKLY